MNAQTFFRSTQRRPDTPVAFQVYDSPRRGPLKGNRIRVREFALSRIQAAQSLLYVFSIIVLQDLRIYCEVHARISAMFCDMRFLDCL